MKVLFIISFASLLTGSCFAQSILFQQDFSAGGVLSDYVSSTPGTTKFNGISGPAVAIAGGALQFDRPNNATTGHFAYTTGFSPSPSSLYIQMDFEVVSATTIAGNSALLFYVGNAFSNGPGNPSNADIYARFGINFTGNGHEFSVRHVPVGGTGSFNSATFTGRQTLTFVLNNTGFTVTYLRPGGGLKTLTSDTYDLWVGSTQVVNGLPVITPNQTMTDFKLRIDDDIYAAVFQFDNFLIRDINGALPVSVLDLKAVSVGSHVAISWQSASPSAGTFAVERSSDAIDFSAIAELQADSTSNGQRTYHVSDNVPTPGLTYYRLRQTNRDGQRLMSQIVTVDVPTNVPGFTVSGNPSEGVHIGVQPTNLPNATYLLTTVTGQQVRCQQQKTPDGQVTLLPQHPLPSGVYLLTAQTKNARITRRFLVH